jgi:hypothetical protein
MKPLTLLFGQPRSGTTWIGKIFDSHPETLYRHEPDSGGTLNDIPLFAFPNHWGKYQSTLRIFVDILPRTKSSRVAGSLPMFPKRYMSTTRWLLRHVALAMTKTSSTLGYELPLPPIQADQGHVVWKSIESCGRLGVIARALPECRAILILRHPCAVVASVLNGEWKHYFGDMTPSSEDYHSLEMLVASSPATSNAPSLSTMSKLHPVKRLAWRWVLSNDKALRDIAPLENCMYIRYEDMCAEPHLKAQQLFHFAGLSWHPQVEKFIKRSISRDSQRYYGVFKDPAVAATKWQAQLAPEDIERVMNVIQNSRFSDMYGISDTYAQMSRANLIGPDTPLQTIST